MCLASIDMTALPELNESVIDVCDCCDGSGKIEWAYHANSPEPDGIRAHAVSDTRWSKSDDWRP